MMNKKNKVCWILVEEKEDSKDWKDSESDTSYMTLRFITLLYAHTEEREREDVRVPKAG